LPGPPTNLAAQPSAKAYIDLSWDPPAGDGNFEITGYRVYQSNGPGEAQRLVGETARTALRDVLVADGAAYCHTVKAVNEAGEGHASQEVCSSVPAPTVMTFGMGPYLAEPGNTETERRSPIPATMPPGVRIVQVAAGTDHSLGLTSTGEVVSWGFNSEGQLGHNSAGASRVCTDQACTTFLSGIRKVAVGSQLSLALDNDGGVWAWGVNFRGQLGNGTTNPQSRPVRVKFPIESLQSGMVPLDMRVSDISGGDYHALAVAGGRIWAWGDNQMGQAGPAAAQPAGTNGALASCTKPCTTIPVPVDPGHSNVIAVSAGTTHSLALTSSGSVLSWGDNTYGQLGYEVLREVAGEPPQVSADVNSAIPSLYLPLNPFPTPVYLPGAKVTSIAAGDNHSLAILSDGQTFAWGLANQGQLGNGDIPSAGEPPYAPLPVKAHLQGPSSVSAGNDHSHAVKDSVLYGWGTNDSGRAGLGEKPSAAVPTRIPVPCGIKVLDSDGGGNHGVAAVESAPPRAPERVFLGVFLNTEDGKVQLSWRSPWDFGCKIQEYKVYRSTTRDSGFQEVGSGRWDPGCRDTDDCWTFQESEPMQGNKACYYVTAINIGGISPADPECITTPPAPSMDRLLDGNGGVTMQWRAVDAYPPVTSYSIYRSRAGIGKTKIATVAASTLRYVDSGLTNGAEYLYTITATNTVGTSPQSSKALGRPHRIAPIIGWGSNVAGQLGTGSTEVENPLPAEAVFPAGSADPVALGGSASPGRNFFPDGGFVFALLKDGSLLGWGRNDRGQLGKGDTERSPLPVPVLIPPTLKVESFAAGPNHAVALTTDHQVLVWGDNSSAQLGITCNPADPPAAGPRQGPSPADTLNDAIRAQTGDSLSYSPIPVPAVCLHDHEVKAVAAGFGFTIALTDDGKVLAWGKNDKGQLGDGEGGAPTTPDSLRGYLNQPYAGPIRATPGFVKFPAGVVIERIAAAESHAIAIATNGSVYAWGDDAHGQLGDGTGPQDCPGCTSYLPTRIDFAGARGAVPSADNTLLISSAGVAAAGWNNLGQLGDPLLEAQSSAKFIPTAI
ncbi:MAG: fibronectin type III domain-containing protein, partial [Actinomycetota bacterium]